MQTTSGFDGMHTGDPTQETTRTTDHLASLDQAPRVPGLVILSHPDPQRVGERVVLPELVSGQAVSLSRLQPLFVGQADGTSAPRPLEEPHLSRRPLMLLPPAGQGAPEGGVTLDAGQVKTSVRVNDEVLTGRLALTATQIEAGVVLVLARRVALLLHLMDPVPPVLPSFGLEGSSDAILRLRQEVRAAAELDVPVLLRGESGTGKELAARALHDIGRRRHRPFVAVNMGALPPSLAAAELFGAVRGAYTGADRAKQGFFQRAEGGTLFLDEIGAAPMEVQVALLRALESGEIHAVGSADGRQIDVRVLAATDEDLEAAIELGSFRAPLLYRLAGCEIHLPPLRERRDDVARLLYHFLGRELADLTTPEKLEHSGSETPWPPAQLVARLVRYDWPGNVRQLRNVARQLVMYRNSPDPHTDAASLERLLPSTSLSRRLRSSGAERSDDSTIDRSAEPAVTASGRFRRAVEVPEEELLEVLEQHHWQLKPAAQALGVSRPTLYRLIDDCAQLRKAADVAETELREALQRAKGSLRRAAIELRVSPVGLKRRVSALGLNVSS